MYRIVSCFSNPRTVRLLGCITCALVIAFAFGSRALAGDSTTNPAINYITTGHGSEPIVRSELDTSAGQVYIYTGGFLPVGAHPAMFEYMFGSTAESALSGFITPILLESTTVESSTIYTVVGIAKGFAVKPGSAVQRIQFKMIEGIGMATNGQFTFGFINAMVNSSGVSTATSPGTVDMDDPAVGGEGVGGPGTTNAWGATATSGTPSPVVTLGTTFGAPGAGADFTFLLPYRTYSAQAFVTVVSQ
jgi:hypothetical protein